MESRRSVSSRLGRLVLAVCVALNVTFLAGCPPNANGPSVRTKKNVVVTAVFSTGASRVGVDSTGYAMGVTSPMDLSSYDSIEVFWKSTFHPYPAPHGEAYSTGLFRVLTGTSSYMYFQTAPADSVASYDIVVPAKDIASPQNVRLYVTAGSTNAGTASHDTVSGFSVHGWKW